MVVKNHSFSLDDPATIKIDLSDLDRREMDALRREAMERGCSLPELIGQFVQEITRRTLHSPNPSENILKVFDPDES